MSEKYVSFVFDDGPNELIYDMVDKISAYGFKASFAIMGRKINDETEKQLQYAIDNGFELVSHGWEHVHLSKLNTREEMIDEIYRPIEEVKRRLGYEIKYARLPFIAYNDTVLEVMTELKLPLLGQGIDGGGDWSRESKVEDITNAILNSVSDGAIACLHVLPNTSKALDIVLPELKKKGYILVTAEELFKIKNVKNIPLGININNANQII